MSDDLQRLADLEAIRDLPRRYAHFVWQGDAKGACALFTDDGVMDTGDRRVKHAAETLLILTGQSSRARGRAHWTSRMKICKSNPTTGQRIDVRCPMNFASIAPQVAIA